MKFHLIYERGEAYFSAFRMSRKEGMFAVNFEEEIVDIVVVGEMVYQHYIELYR